MEISTYKECAKYISENVKDEGVRELVFGEKNVTFRLIKTSAPIFRVMLCTFSLIYLKWLSYSRQELRKFSGKHSKKVFGVLEDLYKSVQFDSDIMIFVLTEAQKDIIENGENSFFDKIISKENFCAYSKLYELAYKCPKLEQADEKDEGVLLSQLVNVIGNSVWLESAVYNQQNNAFVFGGREIPCRDIIVSHGADEAKHILIDKEHISDKVRRDYMSFFGFNRMITIGGEIV
ncbi:MAG: hypothetical protein E7516_07695 [Ruminococcaceae bacterium]|nr:hypothetical protein [Oscillospiraceae bacterium]